MRAHACCAHNSLQPAGHQTCGQGDLPATRLLGDASCQRGVGLLAADACRLPALHRQGHCTRLLLPPLWLAWLCGRQHAVAKLWQLQGVAALFVNTQVACAPPGLPLQRAAECTCGQSCRWVAWGPGRQRTVNTRSCDCGSRDQQPHPPLLAKTPSPTDSAARRAALAAMRCCRSSSRPLRSLLCACMRCRRYQRVSRPPQPQQHRRD